MNKPFIAIQLPADIEVEKVYDEYSIIEGYYIDSEKDLELLKSKLRKQLEEKRIRSLNVRIL